MPDTSDPSALMPQLILLLLREAFRTGRVCDLSPWELVSVLYIDQHGPMPLRQLAEWTGIPSGQITKIVDRLEAAGYVRRVKHPTDRRIVLVTMRVGGRRHLAYGLSETLSALQSASTAPEWAPVVAALWAQHPDPGVD